jgi:hypothetical protein
MKKLQWNRPTQKTLATGTVRRVWRSSCGSYRVEELRHAGLPTVYLAIFADWRDCGLILARRGGRRAAENDCRAHRAAIWRAAVAARKAAAAKKAHKRKGGAQ